MRVLVTKLQKVERVAFAPEGTHLFASGLHASSLGYGDKDTGIEVFDLARRTESTARLFADREITWFAPLTGRRLAVAHRGRRPDSILATATLALADWGGRAPVDVGRAEGPCAVSPDGCYLIAGVKNGLAYGRNCRGDMAFEQEFRRWTLPEGDGLSTDWHITDWHLRLGYDRTIQATAFAPAGRALWSAERVVSRTPPRLRVEFLPRETKTGGELGPAVAYPNQSITGLALGDTFAVAHDGPTLFVYDLAKLDKKPKKVTNPAKRKHFGGFAIHPSGKWLAAAGLGGAVTLWDTTTWKVAQSWTWDAGQSRSVCFSADGTLAAAGTDAGKVVVWDLDL